MWRTEEGQFTKVPFFSVKEISRKARKGKKAMRRKIGHGEMTVIFGRDGHSGTCYARQRYRWSAGR